MRILPGTIIRSREYVLRKWGGSCRLGDIGFYICEREDGQHLVAYNGGLASVDRLTFDLVVGLSVGDIVQANNKKGVVMRIDTSSGDVRVTVVFKDGIKTGFWPSDFDVVAGVEVAHASRREKHLSSAALANRRVST